jgi:hypothetical protein
MERERAIRKMILQAKRDGVVPLECFGSLWYYFGLMYVAGFDGNNEKETNGCQKPVLQLDLKKIPIAEYPGAGFVARKFDIPKSTLLTAIKKGTKIKKVNCYWMYRDEFIEKESRKKLKERSVLPDHKNDHIRNPPFQ